MTTSTPNLQFPIMPKSFNRKNTKRSNILKYLRTKTFSDSSGNFLSAVDLFVFASAQNNHGMREFMPNAMTVDRSLCCFCKH